MGQNLGRPVCPLLFPEATAKDTRVAYITTQKPLLELQQPVSLRGTCGPWDPTGGATMAESQAKGAEVKSCNLSLRFPGMLSAVAHRKYIATVLTPG